jgi:hypothetical protein
LSENKDFEMGRKRIKKAPQSDSDESFDEEEAKEVYSKKTYVREMPTDLVCFEILLSHCVNQT